MKKKYPSTAKSIEDELPPHEPQAEAFLLACAVHKPEILVGLTPELFYLVEHQTILVDMKRMKADGRKSVETPELFEHDLMLSLPRNVFQAINIALNELPSPANWTYWQEIVVERAHACSTASRMR